MESKKVWYYLELLGGGVGWLGGVGIGLGVGVGVCDLTGGGIGCCCCCCCIIGVIDGGGWDSAGDGLFCVAKRCSISCSCCNALTNAVFKRLVCSALRAFLTFVVTHCSHITFGSLPAVKENISIKILSTKQIKFLTNFIIEPSSISKWNYWKMIFER